MKKITAEELAMLFHASYERLAPLFGYETRPETRLFNPNSTNDRLMIETCGEILQELQIPMTRGPQQGGPDDLSDLARGQTYSTVLSNPPPDEWGSFQFTTSADAKRAEEMFNQLSSENDHFRSENAQLAEALSMLYQDTADYIRLNHLGDVHHNRSMQLAAAILSKIGPQSAR